MYQLETTDAASEALAKLTSATALRILSKLHWLATNCESLSHEAVKGRRFAGLHKIRVGDYRVFYALDHQRHIVSVRLIGHRSNIYK